MQALSDSFLLTTWMGQGPFLWAGVCTEGAKDLIDLGLLLCSVKRYERKGGQTVIASQAIKGNCNTMMNLPLWYFIIHVVILAPSESIPITGKSIAYFYRTKAQCQRVLKAMEKQIPKMNIETPEDGVKAILGTECRQAQINEKAIKRFHLEKKGLLL